LAKARISLKPPGTARLNTPAAARIQDRYPGHYQLNDPLFPVGSTIETQYIASLLEARMDFPTTLPDSAMGR